MFTFPGPVGRPIGVGRPDEINLHQYASPYKAESGKDGILHYREEYAYVARFIEWPPKRR